MPDKFEPESSRDQVSGREYGETVGVFGCRRRGRALGPRLVFAIFLIVAGTLLFLNNIGLIPVHDIWVYWPLVLVALGVAKLASSYGRVGQVWGIILVAGGALLLAGNLGLVHLRDNMFWPLLLIVFGVVVLVQTLESRKASKHAFGFPRGPARSSDTQLRDSAIFGNVKRKLDTQTFQGGEVFSVFGSVDIDLRRAQISSIEKSASLEVSAVFGSVKIRIPDTWKVDVNGTAILGSYEDKTIPPRASAETPTLVITGYSVFGSVEIED
jgi:predicted membrane protein